MSKSTRGIRAAGVASLAVTLSIGVAAPALAVDGFELTRVAGDNRYETAVEVAELYGAKPDAIIANGQPGMYADALGGNYLAGVKDAPILLTKVKELPSVTLAQLDDMNAERVWVVGGPDVVPASQVTQLETAGYDVVRIFGEDRFDTNAAVIAEGEDSTDGVGLIATGLNFPDALAAGPFAYQGHSLGLSRTNNLPDAVGDALEADGVTQVLIFGGTDVVGAGVVADLTARGITVLERFDGADRSETSEMAANWALENLDFTDEHVGVASGYQDGGGADALAGGPLEGKEMSPMLITKNVDNPDDALDYIADHSDTLADGHLYGGPAAVSDAAKAAMEEAGQGDAPASNQDYTATGGSDAAATNIRSDASPNENRGSRTYTFNVGSATVVDIALIPSDEVTVADNGTATFGDNEGPANQADDLGNAGGAVIETVNGVDVADNDYINNVSVTNGTVSFSVDSTTPNITVRPVVFTDTNNNDALDLDANDQPTENFGVGGSKTWTRTEAAEGAPAANRTIEWVNKDSNQFSTQDGVYNYDANDQFRIWNGANCVPVTLANFEQNLSTNDVYRTESTYSQDEAASSVFCIEDAAPTKVTNVNAQPVSSTEITVTWTAVSGATSYNVYRVVDTTPGDDCPAATQLVGTSSTNEFKDTGLTPQTTYCYQVAAVADGDEGAKSDADAGTDGASDAKATTLSAGTTAAPQSEDVRILTDTNFPGEASPTDQWRVIFSEPMNPNTAGDILRVQDAQGEFRNAVCDGTELTCSFNASPVTIGGTTYEAGRVLTVTVGTIGALSDNDGNAANNNGQLNYPLTITNQNGFVDQDPTPKAWVPTTSPDNVIDNEANTQPTTQVAPTMTAADSDATANTITVTYSEPVNCTDNAAAQAQFTATGTSAVNPTAVACDGTATVVLTFADVTAAGTLTYTDPEAAVQAEDVKDLDNNQAGNQTIAHS